jgi:hypothetical protein
MPRYECLCEKCTKPFELTMTIFSARGGQAQVPDVPGYEGGAAARVLTTQTSKKS